MVNYCANPKCSKPLHYLREGRIFVFDVPEDDPALRVQGARARRVEHYWLCGDCAPTFMLKHTTDDGVTLLARSAVRSRPVSPASSVLVGARLAS